MSLAARIREQLIGSFRAELTEHVQTMTDGLLALEQGRVAGEQRPELVEGQRQTTLEDVFRAAHSLKGAARAVGITAVEQLAHGLEDLLDAMRHHAIEPSPELFTVCYRGLDAIQAVQAAYEAGETTPPVQALQALTDLDSFRSRPHADAPAAPPAPGEEDVDTAKVSGQNMEQDAISPYSAPGGDETIRVSVSKLDALMAHLSELLVSRIRAERRLAQIRQVQEFVAQWQKEWLAVRSAYSHLLRQDVNGILGLRRLEPVEGPRRGGSPEPVLSSSKGGDGRDRLGKDVLHLLDYVGASQERLREVNALMSDLSRQYADDTMHTSLVIDELEQEIKGARVLPLSTITGPFGRMVRDLAQEAGKEAVLHIVGGDTELDKRVLEQIKDPLIHILRNAIDHGIEPPAQRVASGKPRSGTITLSAEQMGNDVVLCVSDDGAGLDLEALRQAVARRRGIEAQGSSEAELVEAMFEVGVSTSPIITDISGRGVGLDVVRRNAEALHGHVDVDWEPGAGTTFTLVLPLTLTSSRGLLVRVSDELFAIPLNAIERILRVSPQEISPLEGRDTVRYDGRPITLVRLDDVLELPPADVTRDSVPMARRAHHSGSSKGDGHILVVVVAAAERRMAFVVDELAGEQEIVVEGLGKQLARVGGIAGATVMGSGEVVLILNVADLIKLATRGERRSILDTLAPGTMARARRRVLIVDDSITTRTLEKNILEAAGYTVQLATDGQEALSAIATGGVPDLLVADIVMPRMDGFELTRRLKGDAHTAGLPVILVTSLDSPEDKARGIEVGADAYIVKSSFDQNNLLETIEQLI